MRRLVLLGVLLAAAVAQDPHLNKAADDNSWRKYADYIWQIEKDNIDRLASFTAKENSSIFFTVNDDVVGYATKGFAKRIPLSRPGVLACNYPGPALSHRREVIAYISRAESRSCGLSLYDIATGEERIIRRIPAAAGDLSWSWDDSELAIPGLNAVKVADGSMRKIAASEYIKTVIPRDENVISVNSGSPIQWSHDGKQIVFGLSLQVPTRKPNEYKVQSKIIRIIDGRSVPPIDGDTPSLSPISDRLAHFDGDEIVVSDLDGSNKKVLGKARRWAVFLRESISGPITWSPDGTRFFFHSIVSEDRNDRVYLMDTNSGQYRRFLNKTSIVIRDWR